MNNNDCLCNRKVRYDDWVKRVIAFLSDTAPKLGDNGTHCATFQSMPVLCKQPDVVFLGYNPNEPWGYSEKDILPERFYEGNPAFYTDRKKHFNKVWRLASAFEWAGYTKPVTDGNFVFFNAVFFGSAKISTFKKIPGSNEAIEKCLEFTREVIHDIFKPKCIICFSVQDCFNLLNTHFVFDDVKQIDTLQSTDPELIEFAKNKEKCAWKISYSCQETVMKGFWNNIPVYGIPHPSGSVSSDDFGAIALYLRSELQKLA